MTHRAIRPSVAALALVLIAAAVGLGGARRADADIGHITLYYDWSGFPVINSEFPLDIVQGPDGNLWYTATASERIGRITPAGAITTYPIGSEGFTAPRDLAVGGDGALWFVDTDFSSYRLGRITTTGAVTAFDDPAFTGAGDIAAGPDGALWIASTHDPEIVRFDPATEQATIYTDGTLSAPFEGGIAPGPDGNLWFTDAQHDRIGRLDPDTGEIDTYPATGIDAPWRITSGPGGDLWFTGLVNDRIGRFDPDTLTMVTTYAHPSGALSGPEGIAAGPDGNVWFTSEDAIGRLTPTGTMTLYDGPVNFRYPRNIVAGPDDAMWFTDSMSDHLGRISTVPMLGSITVVADSRPSNGTDIGFTTTGTGLSPFTLDDDANATLPATRTFGGLASGTYTVTQGTVPGHRLSALECDPFEATSLATRRATITIEPGEHVTCTFTNDRLRPDLLIAPPGGGFVGDDVFASSATAGQTRSSTIGAGATKTFLVRLQNDGFTADSIRMTASSAGSSGYSVRYQRADTGFNLTPFVTAAGSVFTNLAPGASVDIKVKITAAASAARGSTRTVTVRARSDLVGTSVDVVRATVRRP